MPKSAAEEQARLAAEGAKASEQAKAAAQSKAAEEARIAAEKKKQAEEAKLAAAEQAKAAAQVKAAEDAEKARLAAERKKQGDEARLAAAEQASKDAAAKDEKPRADKPADQVVASLPSTEANRDVAKSASPAAQDIPRLLQSELRRVGCKTGETDGEWNASSRRALAAFNEHAKTRLDVKLASIDALDAVKARTGRVCPLDCDRGYRASGDHCVKEKRPERAPKVVQQRERRAAPAGRRGGKCFVANGMSFCE